MIVYECDSCGIPISEDDLNEFGCCPHCRRTSTIFGMMVEEE